MEYMTRCPPKQWLKAQERTAFRHLRTASTADGGMTRRLLLTLYMEVGGKQQSPLLHPDVA